MPPDATLYTRSWMFGPVLADAASIAHHLTLTSASELDLVVVYYLTRCQSDGFNGWSTRIVNPAPRFAKWSDGSHGPCSMDVWWYQLALNKGD